MGSWTYTTPPTFNSNVGNGKQSDYIATDAGWVDATTGELVVAIPNLLARSGGSHIESVTLASPTKAYYKLGDSIIVNVTYNQNVVVTGTPTIATTIGGTAGTLTYFAGSTTNILQFHHVVTTADNGAFIVTGTSITLAGGTIKDVATSANSPVTLTTAPTFHPTVDSIVPTISSAAINGPVFVTGNSINVTTTFSSNVNVTGVPTISLTIGTGTELAHYASGSGTNALVFSYVVQSTDHATAGNFSTAAVVVLNGGTINDVAGNPTTPLTFTAPTTTSVTVN